MNNTIKQIVILSFTLFSFSVGAKENVNGSGATSVVNAKIAAGCSPSASQTDLDVNNVRTTIMGGGDMWWNLDDARYEIPINGDRHSLFAGALWIGGVDAGGQLKVAAMTYRQGGNDFWSGPLNTTTASTSAENCNEWDKHFKLDRADVEEFVARAGDPTYDVPESIKKWPAHEKFAGEDHYLAPFHDVDGDGEYSWETGDYPDYNITGTDNNARLFGDQTLWWVFNDKGNIHGESEADALGLEIHAQAFGFTSDNEVNDMTFYNYKIFNRSTTPLYNTYFGQWVDPDLGNYLDDYVGCDVGLGLGFCYNGDAEDEGGSGYGFNPPAIGVDFFQGPYSDENDGLDNDRDGLVDEIDTIINALGDEILLTEQIIMSKFMYFNNDGSVTGNPGNGQDFYNYLRGIWKDNVPMTFGGDGHGQGVGTTTDLCDFMFPGTSDASFAGKEWTEQTANNLPADRRFVQSAGPFTLEPGAVNEITTGVVWARAKSGGQTASVQLLKIYDREAQALFDNNFNILNGPDAPDLTVRELDQEFIISLSNSNNSNNFEESYSEKDPYITKPDNLLNDPNYEFQGYLVYQLKNSTVSVTDLDDNDKARLVFRSDIKDNVKGIVNQYLDPILGVYTPIEEVSSVLSSGVVGNIDEGVEFSFRLIDDKFALGSPKLVNHKTYYFMSLSYGYNRAEENASPYAVSDADYDGRNQPFISGRRNIQVYSAIPHYTEVENGGTTLNATYGDGVEIKRVEGTGNGGGLLDLTEESIIEVLTSNEHRVLQPVYKQGLGPVNFEVVDPMKIPAGNFMLKLENAVFSSNSGGDQTGLITSYGSWILTNETSGEIVANVNADISTGTEKYITELGFNIKIQQFDNPGTDPLLNDNNGFISSEIEYSNKNDRWLTGLADRDPAFPNAYALNWIRSGSFLDEDNNLMSDYNVTKDPNGIFEGAIIQTNNIFSNFLGESTGGTWAPYCFASDFKDGPGFKLGGMHSYTMSDIKDLQSVDIVFTSDTSKWSRVCVVEAQDDELLAEGNRLKMELRDAPSVDKEGVSAAKFSVNGSMLTMEDSAFYTLDLNLMYAWNSASLSVDTIFPDSLVIIEYNDQLNPSIATDTIFGYEIVNSTYVYDSDGETVDSIIYNDDSNSFVNSQVGMGWFPGYAIDIETGERLNIIFAEDSWQKESELQGNDMLWNPTSKIVTDNFNLGVDPITNQFGMTGGDYLLGGKHFIYVVKGEAWVKGSKEYLVDPLSKDKYSPNYDEGRWIYNQLSDPSNASGRWNVFKNISWVGVPLLAPGKTLLTSDVKVKLRVTKPFKQYETAISTTFYERLHSSNPVLANDTLNHDSTYTVAYINASQTWGGKKVVYNDSTYLPGEQFIADISISNTFSSASNKARVIEGKSENSFNPIYRFNTNDIVATTGDVNIALDAMDAIRAVPNPYYGKSSYETNQLDNRVKITNLPKRATISIFSVSGTLVRKLKKDDSITSMDWDLKNNFGVPIASGLYIIHVRGKFWDGVANQFVEKDKVIKWFGALRPIDLDTF